MAARVRPTEHITHEDVGKLASRPDNQDRPVTHGTRTGRWPARGRDPAERPKLNTDGYGEPVFMFDVGGVPICARTKSDEHTETHLYYAGAILIGCVNKSPLILSGHFDHNLSGQESHKFTSIDDVHEHIRRLLTQEL